MHSFVYTPPFNITTSSHLLALLPNPPPLPAIHNVARYQHPPPHLASVHSSLASTLQATAYLSRRNKRSSRYTAVRPTIASFAFFVLPASCRHDQRQLAPLARLRLARQEQH
jgi:hypothetical protein